jgi:hypothetical protein
MNRHVSAEKLARFRDAGLSRRAARRVTAHLARCDRCQADADALAELPGLLAATQLPPIPAHLAARIETALATESAHRAAGSPALGRDTPGRMAQPSRFPGLRGRPAAGAEGAHRRAGRPLPARRILAAAAMVAIIGAGGYELVSGLGGPSGAAGRSTSSGSRSAAGPAVAPVPQSSANGFSSAHAPAAGGVRPGAVGAPVFGPAEQYRYAGHAGRFTPVHTSTDYVAAQLGQQASATLAAVRSTRPSGPGTYGSQHPGAGSQGAAGQFGASTLARLPGCVGRVAAGQSVLLVDQAAFQGTPATIIVTAPPGTATATQVWAVGTGCSSSATDLLAHQHLP